MRRSASRAARYAAQAGLSSRKHGCKWHYIFRKSWNSISLPTRNQRLARNLPMGLSKLGEARRYRFFDFWRVRTHILETQFFGPILRGHGVQISNGWNEILYQDYVRPRLHITYPDALGRRLRRNYGWIFTIQAVSYLGTLAIHPGPLVSLDQLWARAAIGPIPGQVVLVAGLVFHSGWMAIAGMT